MNRLGKVPFKPAAVVVGLALLFGSAVSLPGQKPDPNLHAARLSYVDGDIQLSQGNEVLADHALVNTPLFEGTEIAAKENGKAEIQFDDGSVARISPNSSLKIAVLRQDAGVNRTELVLTSGLAYFELQGDSSGNHTVARFGDSAVTASGFTVMRVSLDNLPGEVAVFSGNARLERGNALSLDLHGGESVALNASDPNLYNLAEVIEPDSWDAWNADRDQALTTQEAAKTAASGSEPNSANPAWSDLDANGNWYNVPGQGYVWSPTEAASSDWEPYGCGNWVWTPQFGYVWVSCEQWGYLPYTSGYWNYYDDFGWGWTPGYAFPWWTTGGWVCNVGNRPARYQMPHRPHGGPVHPPNDPNRHEGFSQSNPVIAVNRIPRSPTGSPVRVVGRPITIGGTTVQPLRPISPRPIYSPTTASGFRSNSGYGNAGTGNAGYSVHGYQYSGAGSRGSGYVPSANPPSSNGRPGGWVAPSAPGGGYRAPIPKRGYSAPPPSYGGGAPRPSSGGGGGGRISGGGGGASAPHVSSGGGGGGGGHVSSGSGSASPHR